MCFASYSLNLRMKREVATSLVERGVAERVRLTQAYEKKRTELQKHHDAVKAALADHKAKVNSTNYRHCTLIHFPYYFLYRQKLYWKRRANQEHVFHPMDF